MVDKKKKEQTTNNSANVGYATELWKMADTLRGNVDAAIAANLKDLGYGG